jgi:signal transduction histidine kinase
MLRLVAWCARALGLVIVGLLTALDPPSVRGGAAAQLVSFGLVCAGVGLWALSDLRPRPESARLVLLASGLSVVTVAACVGAAPGDSDGLIAYGIVAMLAAAEMLPLPAVLAIGLLGVLGAEISAVVFAAGAGALLGFPLLLVVGVLTGRNRVALRTQAAQARALLEQNELLRTQQRRVDVLDERARIAREIHDVLAHSLGALSIQLQTVKALFTVHGDPDRALEALAKAQRMVSEGMTETRRAVHALRTDTLPLHEEIARAGAEHAERHGVAVRCETSGVPRPLPPDATVALLRVAQEALVNAVKHAPGADLVAIEVDYRPDGVRLVVVNALPEPGSADDASTGPTLQTLNAGYGLTGMRERLRLLRGSLVTGVRGGNWVVEAELPLTAEEPAVSTVSTESSGAIASSGPTMRADR